MNHYVHTKWSKSEQVLCITAYTWSLESKTIVSKCIYGEPVQGRNREADVEKGPCGQRVGEEEGGMNWHIYTTLRKGSWGNCLLGSSAGGSAAT